jgi:hypothetical protein
MRYLGAHPTRKKENNKAVHVPYEHTNKQHQPHRERHNHPRTATEPTPQRMKTRTPPPPTRTSIATGEHTRTQRGAHASQASKQAHPAPNAKKKTRPTTTTKQLRRNTHTNDPRGVGCLAKAGRCTHPTRKKKKQATKRRAHVPNVETGPPCPSARKLHTVHPRPKKEHTGKRLQTKEWEGARWLGYTSPPGTTQACSKKPQPASHRALLLSRNAAPCTNVRATVEHKAKNNNRHSEQVMELSERIRRAQTQTSPYQTQTHRLK